MVTIALSLTEASCQHQCLQ